MCHGCSTPWLERLCLGDMVFSWVRKGKKRGGLLLYAFFGLFENKEIVGRLTIKGGQFKG